MRPVRACQQCRVSKRKCIEALGLHAACIQCQQRNSECSKSTRPWNFRKIAPTTIGKVPEHQDAEGNQPLSFEVIAEFVELYMRFVHDRPHSLFHEKTLWNDIRTNSLPQCLLSAICAMGCRFSRRLEHRHLGISLRIKASTLFSLQLETISLPGIQTCILLANLYAAEQNNELEALYFGIANRMARVLRFHEMHAQDPPVLQEIKCRVWWTLFMADRWCPPGLSLPREMISSEQLLDLPVDEIYFQNMDVSTRIYPRARSEGLWKFMITLADILGPIQDLNQSLVRGVNEQQEIYQTVAHLTKRIQVWHDTLPDHMALTDENLRAYRCSGHGGTFVALHLGYHHYSTLLFFQYLDAESDITTGAAEYADRCRFHAASFSRLLHRARKEGDCHVVYLTVAHMTMVSSSVLLHTLLFGIDGEIEAARQQLTYNFEALVELKNYWPNMDQITQRLLTFQNACLRSTNTKTHRVDGWMVRFLLEHALPFVGKDRRDSDGELSSLPSPLTPNHQVSSERTQMLSEAFAGLHEH